MDETRFVVHLAPVERLAKSDDSPGSSTEEVEEDGGEEVNKGCTGRKKKAKKEGEEESVGKSWAAGATTFAREEMQGEARRQTLARGFGGLPDLQKSLDGPVKLSDEEAEQAFRAMVRTQARRWKSGRSSWEFEGVESRDDLIVHVRDDVLQRQTWDAGLHRAIKNIGARLDAVIEEEIGAVVPDAKFQPGRTTGEVQAVPGHKVSA
jgi:hypothetical protein